MKRKKVLFIASHRPGRAPGQRFRFEQYFTFLEANGFDCELSYIISAEDDRKLYRRGHYLQKFLIHRRGIAKRKADLARVKDFDIVFIFREAMLTGSTYFERMFRKAGAKMIFDFDDAIWHLDVSEANRMFSFLKRPQKTGEIISMCDLVFAGNAYLANYASGFNKNVKIVPTTIDTDLYKRVSVQNEKIIIGWSGSLTTIKHFEFALPFLRELKKTYADRITFKVIGDESYVNEELDIKGIRWTEESELKELSSFDIGIMPLPDDEWAKGKCGLKGLQYMALGIPAIMSPVGVNTEIIQDGVNGFLATSKEEWVGKISRLIESADLRKSIGEEAVRTVEEKYSVNAWKGKYVELMEILSEKPSQKA